jgi:hypothetical protein
MPDAWPHFVGGAHPLFTARGPRELGLRGRVGQLEEKRFERKNYVNVITTHEGCTTITTIGKVIVVAWD